MAETCLRGVDRCCRETPLAHKKGEAWYIREVVYRSSVEQTVFHGLAHAQSWNNCLVHENSTEARETVAETLRVEYPRGAWPSRHNSARRRGSAELESGTGGSARGSIGRASGA